MAADKPVRAVGDSLWIWHADPRGPAPFGRWERSTVVGETSRSWLARMAPFGREVKLAKNDASIAWSERDTRVQDIEREAKCWIWGNAYKIEACVSSWIRERGLDPDAHRQIYSLCSEIEFDATPLFDLLAERDRLRLNPEPDPTPLPQEADRA